MNDSLSPALRLRTPYPCVAVARHRPDDSAGLTCEQSTTGQARIADKHPCRRAEGDPPPDGPSGTHGDGSPERPAPAAMLATRSTGPLTRSAARRLATQDIAQDAIRLPGAAADAAHGSGSAHAATGTTLAGAQQPASQRQEAAVSSHPVGEGARSAIAGAAAAEPGICGDAAPSTPARGGVAGARPSLAAGNDEDSTTGPTKAGSKAARQAAQQSNKMAPTAAKESQVRVCPLRFMFCLHIQ